MISARRAFAAALAALALAACAGGGAQDRVVYHLIEVNPNAKIIVVAHARGVDFMMKGVKDANGNVYEDLVQQLVDRGVQFDVCEITLRNRQLKRDQFISYSTFVPSGVAEITRLQQREGYAYLKP
jgi:hypothetical protein